MVSSIRNVEELARSLRNFEWLETAVSGATDVDFLVERNHHFLVMEFKPWQKCVLMGYGQFLALSRLAKQPNTTMLLVAEGAEGEPLYVCDLVASHVMVTRDGALKVLWRESVFTRMSRDQLRGLVRKWWETHAPAGKGSS